MATTTIKAKGIIAFSHLSENASDRNSNMSFQPSILISDFDFKNEDTSEVDYSELINSLTTKQSGDPRTIKGPKDEAGNQEKINIAQIKISPEAASTMTNIVNGEKEVLELNEGDELMANAKIEFLISVGHDKTYNNLYGRATAIKVYDAEVYEGNSSNPLEDFEI